MKKLLSFLIFLLSIQAISFAGINNISEEDGSPSIYPWKLKVTNGSLTDNGDGTASLSTGGGGGGMSIGGTVTSGTTGSVLYVGAGPVLAQDNADFFFDATNIRWGYGTSSPGNFITAVAKQPSSVGTTPGTTAAVTGAYSLIGGVGGNTTIATTGVGGIGGGFIVTGGVGGTAASAVTSQTGGVGGSTLFNSGAGAAVSGTAATNIAGASGIATFNSGTGGASTGTGATQSRGGTSGVLTCESGNGGNASGSSGTNQGGNSGGANYQSGNGGTATGGTTANGGSGGQTSYRSGSGGNATGGTSNTSGGNGASLTMFAGNGGTAIFSGSGVNMTGGPGGSFTLQGGTGSGISGGSGTGTQRAGGGGGFNMAGGQGSAADGGAVSTSVFAGDGGAVNVNGGTGGTGSGSKSGGSNSSGNGGGIAYSAGGSGNVTLSSNVATGTVGNAGAISFGAGSAGTFSGGSGTSATTYNGKAGGSVSFTGGAGSVNNVNINNATTNAGSGGALIFNAGSGGSSTGSSTGNTRVGGVGGPITFTAGNGGQATTGSVNSAGVGADITLSPGSGGSNGGGAITAANGGNLYLKAGQTSTGEIGTNGSIYFQTALGLLGTAPTTNATIFSSGNMLIGASETNYDGTDSALTTTVENGMLTAPTGANVAIDWTGSTFATNTQTGSPVNFTYGIYSSYLGRYSVVDTTNTADVNIVPSQTTPFALDFNQTGYDDSTGDHTYHYKIYSRTNSSTEYGQPLNVDVPVGIDPSGGAGVINYGSGSYVANGDTITYRVYEAYQSWGKFSFNYTQIIVTDNGSTNPYNVDLSWTASANSQGIYRIIRDINGGGFNDYTDVTTTNTFNDDNTLWTAGSTVTPAVDFAITGAWTDFSATGVNDYLVRLKIDSGTFSSQVVGAGINDNNTAWGADTTPTPNADFSLNITWGNPASYTNFRVLADTPSFPSYTYHRDVSATSFSDDNVTWTLGAVVTPSTIYGFKTDGNIYSAGNVYAATGHFTGKLTVDGVIDPTDIILSTDNVPTPRTLSVADQTTNNTDGNELIIKGSKGKGTAAGGTIAITAGNADTQGNGGNFSMISGSGAGTGNGGHFLMSANDGGASGGDGGYFQVTAGNATSGTANGGDIRFLSGLHHGGGTPGTFKFTSAVGSGTGSLNFSGLSGNRIYTFPDSSITLGNGDISSVGNCTSGACFDGTQGTTLTYYNGGGNATQSYDGTNFTLNKPTISDFLVTSTTGVSETAINGALYLKGKKAASSNNNLIFDFEQSGRVAMKSNTAETLEYQGKNGVANFGSRSTIGTANMYITTDVPTEYASLELFTDYDALSPVLYDNQWVVGIGGSTSADPENFFLFQALGGLSSTNYIGIYIDAASGEFDINNSFSVSKDGKIGLLETGSSPTKFCYFQAGDQSIDLTYTLPTAYPTGNGYAMTSTTAGVMSWTSVPSIVGNDRKTGLTASQALATYTVGASDASYEVSANVLVTTATLHSFTCTCTYTDEGNTSRTLTLNFSTIAGAITPTIANAGGALPYEGVPLHIRCKAGTTIIIATTGTFTTVTYNLEERIKQQ